MRSLKLAACEDRKRVLTSSNAFFSLAGATPGVFVFPPAGVLLWKRNLSGVLEKGRDPYSIT